MTEEPRGRLRTYKGTGVSPGIAIGRALILEKRGGSIYRVPIRPDDVAKELRRFDQAIAHTKAEIEDLREKVTRSMGDEYASIFDAHAMIIEDPSFVDEIRQRIESELISAEWAVTTVKDELLARFDSFEDAYLRERGEDISDVARTLIESLEGNARHDLSEIEHDVIILADDVTPSDAVHYNRKPIVGFATESGGRTSHTSIIAKSIFLPAVIGVPRLTEMIDNEELVIIDGWEGTIHVNPSRAMIEECLSRERRHREQEGRLLENRDVPPVTRDGRTVTLRANIELVPEVNDAIRFGAEGIGLYRSEFLYISKSPDLPSEDEHYEVYRELLEKMSPNTTIIRTFDLGGKKLAREVIGSDEDNPVLGLRGLRLCMRHRDMFRTQLRALYRASVHGDLWIMFPLVSNLQEVRHVKALLKEIERQLEAEGIEFRKDIPVGIMIEVPAAALIADILATEVDFFSIGTNDLIQYSLAIDRGNENVEYLYEPFHPGVLRMIRGVIRAGSEANIPVSLCGEMAGDPIFTAILLGLGLEHFSMSPASIPMVKSVITNLKYSDSRRIAEQALLRKTAQEIEEYVIEQVATRIPQGLSRFG
ncbi:MAG: phosphoenolpyruvate--protein phosphotransferase [Acidobacteria bacterium]|nr:phosphoenolpyruvate--protein phosphotransferase [Acidobacteriota bacterium]